MQQRDSLKDVSTAPTLTGIARQAGVSVSTVSKVLNGGTDVAPATRQTVQTLLTQSGYRRPRASRRACRSALVDLLINEVDSAWAMSVICGVEEVVEKAGFSLVLSAAHHRPDGVRHWLDGILDRGSLGAVVVHSVLTPAQQAELHRRDLPFVLVDPPLPLAGLPPGGAVVAAGNVEGAREATEHLIGLGHVRIAAVGGPQHVVAARDRLDGYRQALAEAGLPLETGLIRSGPFLPSFGALAAGEFLRLPEPPTAVLAGNDQQACGVLSVLRDRGIDVPGQVSLVGFDDQDFCGWLVPRLTTVRQPLLDMGRTAARLLFDLVAGRRSDPLFRELPASLVLRDSTAPSPSFEIR
ncbi:MAG: LacI family transcriptional regulator, xylobiose transport system transcriptional regulator [Actinomycetota bacterium]|nr:LacI family transcriptional regulator, xylobiose transport system transcriptional regulator [Actinomycetota bacterium]